jgi:hypothetical protein
MAKAPKTMSKLENGILFSGDDHVCPAPSQRVAKRGRPGTPEKGRWIPLEPGFEVFDNDDHTAIEVVYCGVSVQ